MEIAILLPYKENFSKEYAGAVSIFVNDTNKLSKYKNKIKVYGFTDEKSKLDRYQNIISYFLLLSPAFISYQILDIRGSMRKEILGLLTFVMIVYFINKGKSLTFPLLIFTIAVFSHPANIFIFPF